MNTQAYMAAAELYLGSDSRTAIVQGPRAFRSVAHALKFAIEEAAPVSLRGARVTSAGHSFGMTDMLALYHSRRYPLARKARD